ALHREAETQVLPARIHTAELALTAEEQVAAVRAYQLSNDEAYRRRFESARARQLTALGRVRAVIPALGATARSHVDAVAVLVDSIHAIHADVLYRGTTREEYVALLPTLEAHIDSVRLHVGGIQAGITRASEEQLR